MSETITLHLDGRAVAFDKRAYQSIPQEITMAKKIQLEVLGFLRDIDIAGVASFLLIRQVAQTE